METPNQIAACPDDVFVLMSSCWNVDPAKRPTFKFLFGKLSALKDKYEHVVMTGVTD